MASVRFLWWLIMMTKGSWIRLPIRGGLPAALSVALAAALTVTGCRSEPTYENLEAAGMVSTGDGPLPAVREDDNPPEAVFSGGRVRPWLAPSLSRQGEAARIEKSRLESEQRLIEGRVNSIDRQLDVIAIDHRREGQIDPALRYRTPPRASLLLRERRALEAEQETVQRELNRLEFRRRTAPPPDPLGPPSRFRSRSILSQ